MDPLSITASAAGIISLALTVSSGLCQMIGNTKDAPRDVTAISSEIRVFEGVLKDLGTLVNNGIIQKDAAQLLQPPLLNCLETLKLLNTKIEPHVKEYESKRNRKRKKAKWKSSLMWTIFQKDDVKKLSDRLAHNKMTLSTAIEIINVTRLHVHAAQLGGQFESLRMEVTARGMTRVNQASILARHGSVHGTDIGFNLRRFLENESVIDPNADGHPFAPSEFGGTWQYDDDEIGEAVITPLSTGSPTSPTAEPEIGTQRSMPNLKPLKPNSLNTIRISNTSDTVFATEIHQNGSVHPPSDLINLESGHEGFASNDQDDTGGELVQELFDFIKEDNLKGIQRLLRSQYGSDPNSVSCNGWTPLNWAIKNNNVEATRKLISLGADIEATVMRTSHPLTPLQFATETDRLELIRLLLLNSADINAHDPVYGYTALHIAAKHGRSDKAVAPINSLLKLIDNGIDQKVESEATDKDGWTPLMHAAKSGHPKTVSFFLKHIPWLPARNETGWTALHIAVAYDRHQIVELLLGHPGVKKWLDFGAGDHHQLPLNLATDRAEPNTQIVKLLLDSGANVNGLNSRGNTAIIDAVLHRSLALVKMLLQKGANPEKPEYCASLDGYGCLHLAALAGDEALLKILLDNGAELEAKDKNGYTPFLLAVAKGQTMSAQILLDRGADPSSGNDFATALGLAVSNSDCEMICLILQKNIQAAQYGENLVRFHFEEGIDVNRADKLRMSLALLAACKIGHAEAVNILIANDADVNASTVFSETPLMLACAGDHVNIIQLLVRCGADIDIIQADGGYLWTSAASFSMETIVLLLHLGTEVDAKDLGGESLLALLSRLGSYEVMRAVLKHGADINIRNRWSRKTALMQAAEGGNLEIVKLLLEHGALAAELDIAGNSAMDLARKNGHFDVTKEILKRYMERDNNDSYVA